MATDGDTTLKFVGPGEDEPEVLDHPVILFNRFDAAISRGHLALAIEIQKQLKRCGYRVSTCRLKPEGRRA